MSKIGGIDLRKDRHALQQLKGGTEKVKIELSSMLENEVNMPFITAGASGPQHLQLKITPAKLEHLCTPLVQRCRGPFEAALRDAKRTLQDLDELVLIGGVTRVSMIQQLGRELTPDRQPNKSVNLDEVVTVGATIQAGVRGDEMRNVLLLEVTQFSPGVEMQGGVMTALIPSNTTIPTRKSEVFSTAADAQTAVDIHVLQGECPMAADNMTLGTFRQVRPDSLVEALTRSAIRGGIKLVDDIQHGHLLQIGKLPSTFDSSTPSHLRVILDRRIWLDTNAYMVLIANMPFFGPRFQIAPDVSCNDSRLEGFFFLDMSRLDLISYAMLSTSGATEDTRVKYGSRIHLGLPVFRTELPTHGYRGYPRHAHSVVTCEDHQGADGSCPPISCHRGNADHRLAGTRSVLSQRSHRPDIFPDDTIQPPVPAWHVVIVTLYAVTILVGFTRIFVGAHYPRDVIEGAVLGSIWGF